MRVAEYRPVFKNDHVVIRTSIPLPMPKKNPQNRPPTGTPGSATYGGRREGLSAETPFIGRGAGVIVVTGDIVAPTASDWDEGTDI